MKLAAAAAIAIISFSSYTNAADSAYTFDASQFEKKPFELGGYVELRFDQFRLNRGSAFYGFSPAGQASRETLDRAREAAPGPRSFLEDRSAWKFQPGDNAS
jgi:hypothetical protein